MSARMVQLQQAAPWTALTAPRTTRMAGMQATTDIMHAMRVVHRALGGEARAGALESEATSPTEACAGTQGDALPGCALQACSMQCYALPGCLMLCRHEAPLQAHQLERYS
eukprot:1157637-Pelagomonas_calceolata.AAC.11